MSNKDFKLRNILKNKLLYLIILLFFTGFNNSIAETDFKNKNIKTIKANEYTPDEHYKHGNKALLLKDYENAIEHYQKVLEADPENYKARDNLGIAYKNTGNLEKAKEIFENNIAQDPHNIVAYKLLGEVYLLQKKNKESLTTYNKVLLLSQKDPEIYFGIGNVYSVMGEHKTANNYYKEAYKLYSKNQKDLKSDVCTNIAINFFKDKKYLRAIDYFEKAIDLNKKNFIAYYYLGLSHLLTTPVNRNMAQKNVKMAVTLGYSAHEEILNILEIEEKELEK